MGNQSIAIVDDESDILELVSLHLQKANYRVHSFTEAASLYRFLEREVPDLVILDLMLPDVDGLEICRYLRGRELFSSIPIIMLTARTDEMDKVIGLELGADDYVTKPFSPRELVARVRAVLRRHGREEGDSRKVFAVGAVTIDLEKHEAAVNNKKLDLTPTEFKILHLLSSKKGRIQSRDQILSFLWGDEKFVVDRTVDVHIRHLREKLGKASHIIKNVRGVGYKVEE